MGFDGSPFQSLEQRIMTNISPHNTRGILSDVIVKSCFRLFYDCLIIQSGEYYPYEIMIY